MALNTYSQQFILYGPETPNTSFAVPDGYTAVIRQITGYQEIGAYDFGVYIADDEDAPATAVYLKIDAGVAEYFEQELRVVVPAGGIITIAISRVGDTPAFYVGGYLLRNTGS